MNLCLGTVQFGMKYGINNTEGQPPLEKSIAMLEYAVNNGITALDTASAYNEAENVVGCFLKVNSKPVNVISKLRPNCLPGESLTTTEIIEREFNETIKKLNVSNLYGYLLHNAEYLYNDEVIDALASLKDKGLIKHYGVSIYDVKDGYYGIEKGCTIIQAPFNVFDQRIRQSGLLDCATSKRVEIHTRSAFLQGLLMMEEEKIPSKLCGIVPYVKKLNELCRKYQINKKELLIAFVKQTRGIERLVFGVDNETQLKEFIDLFDRATISKDIMEEIHCLFNNISEDLILPNMW